MIREDLSNVAIEENNIEFVQRFGIGTFSDTTALSFSSISRNRLERCRGLPAGSDRSGGAIVIGESQEVRFIDNIITNNTPTPGDQFPGWFAVYFEDALGVEMSGNTVTRNGNPDNSGFLGAIFLQGVRGMNRVQNNIVSNNTGIALTIGELRPVAEQVQQVLVQNNHFLEGPNPSFLVLASAIDSLLFQGNQCRGTSVLLYNLPSANVTGNIVEGTTVGALPVMWIHGQELIVSANSVRPGERVLTVTGIQLAAGPVRVIVTSNIASGISATSTGVLVRANNIPAP